jgi:hypothetical protein
MPPRKRDRDIRADKTGTASDQNPHRRAMIAAS